MVVFFLFKILSALLVTQAFFEQLNFFITKNNRRFFYIIKILFYVSDWTRRVCIERWMTIGVLVYIESAMHCGTSLGIGRKRSVSRGSEECLWIVWDTFIVGRGRGDANINCSIGTLNTLLWMGVMLLICSRNG